MPADHHNGHPRSRGDSEPRPCFFVYRGLQRRPTGAGRRPQAAFRAILHARKRRDRKKQKATEPAWGSTPAHCPKSTYKPPFAPLLAPSPPQVAWAHTAPQQSTHHQPSGKQARLCCILVGKVPAAAVGNVEQGPADRQNRSDHGVPPLLRPPPILVTRQAPEHIHRPATRPGHFPYNGQLSRGQNFSNFTAD